MRGKKRKIVLGIHTTEKDEILNNRKTRRKKEVNPERPKERTEEERGIWLGEEY